MELQEAHLIHETAAHTLHIIDIEGWVRKCELGGRDKSVQRERWWAGRGLRSAVGHHEEPQERKRC